MGRVMPIDPRQVGHAEVPYLLNFEPAAVVAAAATVTVTIVMGPRDFMCTHIGFSTTEVGLPARQQRFKLNVRDMGDSIVWAPARFLINAVVGSGGNTEKNLQKLSKPWRFRRGTSIVVELENVGAIACLPSFVMHGYLTKENLQNP